MWESEGVCEENWGRGGWRGEHLHVTLQHRLPPLQHRRPGQHHLLFAAQPRDPEILPGHVVALRGLHQLLRPLPPAAQGGGEGGAALLVLGQLCSLGLVFSLQLRDFGLQPRQQCLVGLDHLAAEREVLLR